MTGTITVAILGADPVADQALGRLLRGAGYNVRLLPEPLPAADAPDETPLAGVGLLLLAPALGDGRREAVLGAVARAPGPTRPPVLRLLSTPSAPGEADRSDVVPWPCGMEELKRRIESRIVGPPAGRG